MHISLDGKVALVTGASRGIGLAAAQRLVEAGASVMLTSRKQENLNEALATFAPQSQVAATTGHVGKSEDADRVVRETIERFGRLERITRYIPPQKVIPASTQSPLVLCALNWHVVYGKRVKPRSRVTSHCDDLVSPMTSPPSS